MTQSEQRFEEWECTRSQEQSTGQVVPQTLIVSPRLSILRMRKVELRRQTDQLSETCEKTALKLIRMVVA